MRLVLSLITLLALGCGGRGRMMSSANVTLPVLNAESARPFVLEQQLRGKYGEREVDAHVVVQFDQGILRLVGLAPFGARAFVVEQRGSEVHVERSMGGELPFDPKHVFVDIHRVLFRSGGAALENGVQQRVDQGELVRDVYRAGRLTERRFTPAAKDGPAVVITFSSKASPVTAPKVRLHNQQVGYTLEIETLSQQWL